MARKTQNSSQSLPSAIVHTSHVSEAPQPRTSGRKTRNASHIPAAPTAHDVLLLTTSNVDGIASGSQGGTEDGQEMDAAENGLLEPAVIAPSVRPSIEGSEQAGLMIEEEVSHDLATPLHQFEESGHVSDDDDYGAVNDISDSSEDEPDVEQVSERVIMKNKGAHPTTNHLRWYEHEEKIQGKLGENESFFDQHVWDDESDSSSLSSDIDYHTAWDGIPDTPVEPSTPVSLAPPRHVHFGGQISRGRFESTRTSPDRSDDVRLPKDALMVGSEVLLDNSDAESGYETEAETTDEEEPPVSAKELIKAPHLLHHSPPVSIIPSPSTRPRGASSSEKGFKVPRMPASHRLSGPKLGTFKSSPSRSYSMAGENGKIVAFEASRPSSPKPPLRRAPMGAYLSNSAPPTPRISHATLSLAPDLSETEFSDAVASQLSADPVLSAGPDFITSAGFSQTAAPIPPPIAPLAQASSDLYPQENFDASVFLNRQANGAEAQFDDLHESEIDCDYEDFIKWGDSSSDDENSIVSGPPHSSEALAMDATSPSAQATHMISPSSASSSHAIDPFSAVDVSTWRKSPSQRPQTRHLPKRPPHGLSLSGNALKSSRHPSQPSNLAKKRKISEVHGGRTSPMSNNKRRVPAVSR